MAQALPKLGLSLVIIRVLLLAKSQQDVHALTINADTTMITQVSISDTIWCSTTGTGCTGCPPLAGASVNLVNGSATIGATTTGADGRFLLLNLPSLIEAGAFIFIGETFPVKVRVQPANNECPALSSGYLEGNLAPRGSIVNGMLNLGVTNMTHVAR